MTTIRDVLRRDPVDNIPNDGVAKVGMPTSANAWNVLRYELRSFVCTGEYERGLDRILNSYLSNLDQPVQPAAWISGFYGSGKSHFVRVLDALWRDLEFPDGATARGLVQGLPDSIRAQLIELSTRGRQTGGIWSASGQLDRGVASPRLGLLRLLLSAAGLPQDYTPARFILWLGEEGYEDAVRASLSASGRRLEREARYLHSSPELGQALLEAIPGLASDGPAARAAVEAQFASERSDISLDELLELTDAILRRQSSDGKRLPLTLIVLDELQQYIGNEDSGRSIEVQNIVEACSSSFDSRLLFVGTGQAALQGTHNLQRLQARFTVRVQLSSNDVHNVVQQVVLAKHPTADAPLRAMLDEHSAEIERQLNGTRLRSVPADREDRVADYPLLPVRRRFMEEVLLAIDKDGTSGQTRSQLKVIQQGVRAIADRPVGHVIPVDVVFDQKRSEMLNNGTLLREIDNEIAKVAGGEGPDARLRARLLATIFLISKLPESDARVTGVRATPEMLADLLIEEITTGSAPVREEVRVALEALAADGTLMSIDGAYHIQTPESREWQQAFTVRQRDIRNDYGRVAGDRADALRKAIDAELKGVPVRQGAVKEDRKFALHFGLEPPAVDGGVLPVWVADEWTTPLSAVRNEAQRLGVASPVVTIFLPRRNGSDLEKALVDFAAARETLETRPEPATDAGRQARDAMISQRNLAEEKVKGLVRQVLESAHVYQGGGAEITGSTLREMVQQGLEAAADRRFPQFGPADQTGWDKVVKRANLGQGLPLEALGYKGEAAAHQVCAQLLGWLSQPRTGGQIRSHFMAPPFGWPQDAIHGALLALVTDGQVRASYAGKARTPKELPHTQIGQTEFVRESQPLSIHEKLALSELFKETIGPGGAAADAPQRVPEFLKQLAELAADAGGDPPLPPRPDTRLVTELRALSGNAQARAVHDQRSELGASFRAWKAASEKRAHRERNWRRLRELLKHGDDRAAFSGIETQTEAIRRQRLLLNDPDPTLPLIDDVTAALRDAIIDARERHRAARDQVEVQLRTTKEWTELPDTVWKELFAEQRLEPAPELPLGNSDQVLAALEKRSLSVWDADIDALPTRMQLAHAAAARRLQPQAVKVAVKNATLTTSAEVDAYLADLRERVMKEVEAGRPVLVQGA